MYISEYDPPKLRIYEDEIPNLPEHAQETVKKLKENTERIHAFFEKNPPYGFFLQRNPNGIGNKIVIQYLEESEIED
jgi:hypothetical protein